MVFLAEQERVQCHLRSGNSRKAELVEKLLTFFSELLDEEVVRCSSVFRFARIAVEMREYAVHAVLIEHIERRTFLEYPSQIEMETVGDTEIELEKGTNLLSFIEIGVDQFMVESRTLTDMKNER